MKVYIVIHEDRRFEQPWVISGVYADKEEAKKYIRKQDEAGARMEQAGYPNGWYTLREEDVINPSQT